MKKINPNNICIGDKVVTRKQVWILGRTLKFEVGKILVDSENCERYLIPKEITPISYISEKEVYNIEREV